LATVAGRTDLRSAGGPSQGGGGLPRWMEQGRPLVDTDVVLWYTLGHTHLPRPEGYPVMPAAYVGSLLKPRGFFAGGPANDVPPAAKKAAAKGSCCHG
jgi:primary-amine oxidase